MATTQTAIRSSAAVRMASLARDVGVPKDSLRRFLSAGYVPQPKQMEFHAAARSCDAANGARDVGFGGVRGESKSHALLAQIALDDCQRAPDLKWLLLRKVGKAVRESFEDLRRKVLNKVPHEYRRQEGVIEFENRSRIVLGHFKNERDIDNYIGIEYDGIGIEEANQLTEKKHAEIRTCRRTSKTYWRPRSYYTFNPGGVGHAHLKKKFITAWRLGVETDTRFVFAARGDNAFVDPDYRRSLDDLTGWQRAAWRDGDWDIAAGQFFTTWRRDVHVIKPFEIPSHWEVWGGFDYGFTHPTVCYPLAFFDGDVYVLGEHYAARQLPPQHAQQIKALGGRLKLDPQWLNKIYAGADVFANKGDARARTIADQYQEQGIPLLRANMDRINRAGEVLKLLGDADAKPPIRSRLKIFNTCTRLIECLPALQHDPHRPEDVLKVDVDDDGNGGDDPYDGLGYGVASKLMSVTVTDEERRIAATFGARRL